MRYITNKKGVTLTELMVTVAIIGIVAAIATPSLRPLIARTRLNSAARDLISDLKLARSLAVGQNQRHYVYFQHDDSNDWYEIRRSSNDQPVAMRPRVDYRDPNQNYSGVRIESIKDKNNTLITTIEFNFNGTAVIGKGGLSTNMPVTITIQKSDGTENKRIVITRFGRVYTE